jgi:hypothetical protein
MGLKLDQSAPFIPSFLRRKHPTEIATLASKRLMRLLGPTILKRAMYGRLGMELPTCCRRNCKQRGIATDPFKRADTPDVNLPFIVYRA